MVYLGTRELELKYDEIDMLIVSICAYIDTQDRLLRRTAAQRQNIEEAEELIEMLTFVRDADHDESDRQKEDRLYMEKIISTGNEGDGVK